MQLHGQQFLSYIALCVSSRTRIVRRDEMLPASLVYGLSRVVRTLPSIP